MECLDLQGRRVLVTGGLGFIGSNLAIRLQSLGAEVIVADNLISGCGGNRNNLPTGLGVRVVEDDIAHAANFLPTLGRIDVVFNLAGEVSHIHSLREPERDLTINSLCQLRFLTALARTNPGVRVVYASTRQVYGRPQYLPVDEEHPVCPVDFNGIHKYAAMQYHLLLSDYSTLDPVILSLTNVYGPRLALDVAGQGVLSVFFRKALAGEPIDVFGDGTQLRDPLYVDDAVDAFILAGTTPAPAERVFNVGGPEPLTLHEIASQIAALASPPVPVRLQPFDPEHKQ